MSDDPLKQFSLSSSFCSSSAKESNSGLFRFEEVNAAEIKRRALKTNNIFKSIHLQYYAQIIARQVTGFNFFLP